jgi:hypothetical protein
MHDREMNGSMDVMLEICIYLIIESDDPERQYLQTTNKKGRMNKWLMKAKGFDSLNPQPQNTEIHLSAMTTEHFVFMSTIVFSSYGQNQQFNP